MKRVALLVAAAAAACSTGSSTVPTRFNGPSAVVQFYGVTRHSSAVKPYLAVADARGGDLRLVDPDANQPVLGPGLVYPLSIFTLPRPLFVAAASLGDGGADVLVSASAGTPTLQVVETWTSENRVRDDLEVPLANLVGSDAEILAIVGLSPSPGRGRIVAAVTGQQLVVVDFTRNPDGSGAVVPGTPVVQQLGFEALDLSVGPNAAGTLSVYAATRDPLSLSGGATVHGVVEIDASADATPFTTTVYDALAPTVAVAAALVHERIIASSEPCAAELFQDQPVLRIYAALDPNACGDGHAIACGIATLDPALSRTPEAGQLAADPALGVTPAAPVDRTPVAVEAQRFRAPIPIVGVPLHIAVANAPSKNSSTANPARVVTAQSLSSSTTCQANGSAQNPLARVLYGSVVRATSAIAMVTSTDGHVYWLDLSRFAPVSDSTPMSGLGRTQVLHASTDTVSANEWQLGLWYDFTGATASGTVLVDSSTMPNAVETWPGFTPTSVWTATYQGALPGLDTRAGVVAFDATGAWVGVQSMVGSDASAAGSWSVSVQVGDPGRGVLPGDTVSLLDLPCSATVDSVVPSPTDPETPPVMAGVAFPGGAIKLQGPPSCLGSASPVITRVTVVATAPGADVSDVVVANDVSGYVGRAPISFSTNPADGVFTLAWKDESALSGVDLAVARRARRIFYPTDDPCPAGSSPGCYTSFPRVADPLSPGPAIRFRLGLRNITTPALAPKEGDHPPAGATVHITTQSGLAQSSRRPTTGGTPPAPLIAVDPGDFPDHTNEDFRFYVAYQDDQVAWFWTTSSTSQVTSIR